MLPVTRWTQKRINQQISNQSDLGRSDASQDKLIGVMEAINHADGSPFDDGVFRCSKHLLPRPPSRLKTLASSSPSARKRKMSDDSR